MAKLTGTVLGRPSGNVGEIVFGAARTRLGKVVTARQLVDPSNPQTPEQQAQRTKFSQALEITQAVGPTIYRDDWNRSVGQLPGFQSWMSLMLDNLGPTDTLDPPPDTPLGNLHFPDTFQVTSGGSAGAIVFDWSTETGPNGTASDEVQIIGITAPADGQGVHPVVIESHLRSDGASGISVGGFATGVLVVSAFYLRGAGTADGLLSLATWDSTTAG